MKTKAKTCSTRLSKTLWAVFALLGLFVRPVATAGAASGTRTFPQEGETSLTSILMELASFVDGKDDAVLYALRAYVRANKDDGTKRAACEDAFLSFLESGAALPGKAAVCRELRLIGTEKAVPVLAKMLAAAGTSDIARYALERIPGDAADETLLKVLSAASGGPRLGIISSLAGRKCAGAVVPLEKMLYAADKMEAAAAAEALGRIGGGEAVRALSGALVKTSGETREWAASGLLACAEGLMGQSDLAGASAAYDGILASKLSVTTRRAAMKGKIAVAGPAAPKIVFGILSGKPSEMLQPAIAMVPGTFDASGIAPVCGLLGKLPEDGQVQLIAVLASYPKEAVLPTLTKAADSSNAAVRTEALRAIGKAGDGACVDLLAQRSARAAGPEQAAARESLWRIRGEDVDAAVLDGLERNVDEAVRNEFIRAAGERRIDRSKKLLLDLARSAAPTVRVQAVRALKRLAGPEDLRPLLLLMLEGGDESEMEELQGAAAAVARTISRPGGGADAVGSFLSSETEPKKKASLLRVLGKLGEDRSLRLVRPALADPDPVVADAAVRAIAEWPTITARDDALRVAGQSPNLVHRVLALQAFVRMIGLERYRSPEGAVASLKQALGLASRPEEKRLVLGALPTFACPAALELAKSLLGSEVQEEARAAVGQIKERLKRD
jgi:HEAT repeat protein